MPRRLRRFLPRTFQDRLTAAFVVVIVPTLLLVAVLVLNRLDDYFTQQQEADLRVRMQTVAVFVQVGAEATAQGGPVIEPDGSVDPAIREFLTSPSQRQLIADLLGQANVFVRFGQTLSNGEQTVFVPAGDTIVIERQAGPAQGQRLESTALTERFGGGSVQSRYTLEITLAQPYTYRATAIGNVTGLLGAITLFALGLSVVVSAWMARRFTTPLRQLTDASRALAEGDLSRRVPAGQLRAGSSELGDLAVQFNTMADRLEESVAVIRRDRDRSRDFLADVSHELRTPLAALRTFNQLLMEGAADDPDARTEFLESSAGQIDRLDWLAQNLLELSKLDSGLVLLDLRPEDLRAAVESATQQLVPVAQRRELDLVVELPDAPLRIRHDPPRIGQVVANLVGNALKFTPRGGTVRVTIGTTPDGARIDVADTGVGIDPAELPHIFDRFYRGSRANEARGSGSGLGLAIVRSIVDMHGGSVAVESGPGTGAHFTVRLPRDPRTVAGTPAARRSDVATAAEGEERRAGQSPLAPPLVPPLVPPAPDDPAPDGPGEMTETSPSDASRMNPASAP